MRYSLHGHIFCCIFFHMLQVHLVHSQTFVHIDDLRAQKKKTKDHLFELALHFLTQICCYIFHLAPLLCDSVKSYWYVPKVLTICKLNYNTSASGHSTVSNSFPFSVSTKGDPLTCCFGDDFVCTNCFAVPLCSNFH